MSQTRREHLVSLTTLPLAAGLGRLPFRAVPIPPPVVVASPLYLVFCRSWPNGNAESSGIPCDWFEQVQLRIFDPHEASRPPGTVVLSRWEIRCRRRPEDSETAAILAGVWEAGRRLDRCYTVFGEPLQGFQMLPADRFAIEGPDLVFSRR